MSDEPRIAHAFFGVLVEQLCGFGQHALHASVLGAARRFVITVQNLLQAGGLLSGLFKMFLEGEDQLRVTGGPDHRGQRLDELSLGAVEAFEFAKVKVFEGLKFHFRVSFGGCGLYLLCLRAEGRGRLAG